jgi:Arc/MetJ family transcription regulator
LNCLRLGHYRCLAWIRTGRHSGPDRRGAAAPSTPRAPVIGRDRTVHTVGFAVFNDALRPDLEIERALREKLFDEQPISSNPSGVPQGPYAHIYDMGFRMKTTLNIDDTVMAELKREAARQGRTMSELVETALRLLLASRRKRGRIPALPKFRSGGALVDVADRDALYHAMEGR